MSKVQLKGGLQSEPESFHVLGAVKSRGTKEYYQFSPKEIEVEEKTHPGILINRNNHPVILSYMGEVIKLSPRERVQINNVNKLGGLCSGVLFVPGLK